MTESENKKEKRSMEEKVVDLLKKRGLTVSFAESCTGGMISANIVNVPGSSDVFAYGFVTYSDQAKKKILAVREKTLKNAGAVSAKCAMEMAKGGLKRSGADICLSITGFAGPGGGNDQYPVGTVFMGCCYHKKCKVREFHFEGDRNSVRKLGTEQALKFLAECIKKMGK